MLGPSNVWTIVVGGGTGRRFGRPKQYELIGGERVIDRSRRIAETVSAGVIVVVPPQDADHEGAVAGGATRSDSVRAGLERVPSEAEIICVHDAARPLASPALYERVVAAVASGADGAVPGVPVADTIKIIDDRDVVVDTPARSSLVAVQTPQAFRAGVLRAAHADGGEGTDDAELVERTGGRVVVVEGEQANRKITHPADLDWVRQAAGTA
ncbi:MAG: 2-C-methyl-D-erythritol 4-phosphate cytidylyltransferase [Ilumatobacter sp.]|uniref:2-C-methyl-D-erythritol 4-phosphate cytidylyltransferase n=1 Tax=Ilumatobacter sp. TaxID=1967498 RepID=UPI002617B746|nr:2-C-methyl-D-erythritol 4-phosphate cytidylyltransferase [Ilumatobacter sp.]MDJ0771478.1 2-C-methyl-D-erythritol 4-phosphate cytidylyltransferase [Ilumatobacter sp.]